MVIYSDRRAMRGQLAGHPDALVLPMAGQAFFAEFKRPGEALRPEQERFFERARRAGIPCWPIRSLDEARRAWVASLPPRTA